MTVEELREKSIEELKALAYDQVKLLQVTQQNVQILESLISEKESQPEKKEQDQHGTE